VHTCAHTSRRDQPASPDFDFAGPDHNCLIQLASDQLTYKLQVVIASQPFVFLGMIQPQHGTKEANTARNAESLCIFL